jgi:beta-barrel assembly-enhancing protease
MYAAVNGHGRSHEAEADDVGMEYLVKAGWDPREAPKMFEALLREYGDQKALENFFYGDHPTNRARIERTTEFARTKYARDIEARHLVVNTEEWAHRTRELVILTGKLDYEQKRFNTATAMFQKAARVDARDPAPHYYLGKIALETVSGPDALDRAIGHLTDATTADDRYAPAYRELGLAYYRKADKARAVAALERYLALAPKAKDAERIRQSVVELNRR